MLHNGLTLMKIAEKEINSKTEVANTLDYIYRQLGRLRVLNRLPRSDMSSNTLENRSRDVKSAIMHHIAINLSHQCNRLGLGGSYLTFGKLMLGRITTTILLGDKTQFSQVEFEKAIDEFNFELMQFGHSIGFKTFDMVRGIWLSNVVIE